MYRLNVGVGFSVLKLKYLPHNENTHIMDIIAQHKLILSEKIITYYMEMADEAYREIIQLYISSLVNVDETHVYFHEVDTEISPKDEIIYFVKQSPMKVLISEEGEFETKKTQKVNLITPRQINNREVNTLYRYTFPVVNHIARRGENCEAYATWMGHLLENEDKIDIVDKFIFNDNGLRCLKKYYFPKIAEGTSINIYCQETGTCSEADIVSELQDAYYKAWNIKVFLCTGMHDRYICAKNLQISLGAGFDFLHSSGVIQKECTINITNFPNASMLPVVVKEVFF